MNKFSRFVDKIIGDVLPPLLGILLALTILAVLGSMFLGAVKLLLWLMGVQV